MAYVLALKSSVLIGWRSSSSSSSSWFSFSFSSFAGRAGTFRHGRRGDADRLLRPGVCSGYKMYTYISK